MEQELSQGVTAVKSLTAAVFEGGTSFQALAGNIAAVGFAAKLHILGVAMQAIGGLANMFKGLFEGITTTETQLVRLSTSLRGMGRDATGATDIFQQAMDKAAETPFDLQQVLHSVTQLGGYGIAALDQLKKKNGEVIRDIRGLPMTLVDALGNVAGATGMSLDRTMEAYADAIMGEWERMKQFGIKKEMIPGLSALQAGTPEYKRLIAEWMATTERFAGGMVKQARTIKGMMSNFGDVFTRFGIEIGGTANKDLANNQEATARTGSKKVMADVKSGKVSASDVMKDYKVNPDAFKGVIAGSTEYTRRLELAIRYSTKLTEETDTIGKAGTLYDAIRISVRQLFNAFGDSSKGIGYLGAAIGQWFKQIWTTFIYPIFTALSQFFRWLGKVGEDYVNGFAAHAQVAGQHVSEIGRKQMTMSERIGELWGVFLSFFWNPLIGAIKAVIGFLGNLYDVFAEVFDALYTLITDPMKAIEEFDAVILGIAVATIPLLIGGFISLASAALAALAPMIVGIFTFAAGVVIATLPFILIGAAVAAVATGVFWLIKNWSTFVGWLKEGWKIFASGPFGPVISALGTVFSFLGKVFGFLGGVVFKAIGFVIGLIIDGIKWLIKGIGWVIKGLIDAGKWVYDGMGKAFSWIAEKFRSWIIDPIKSIGGFFEAVFDGIMSGIRRAVNFIREYTPGMDTRGAATGKSAYETMQKLTRKEITATDARSGIQDAFSSFSGAAAPDFNAKFKKATADSAAFNRNTPEILEATRKLATGEKEVIINLNVDGRSTKFKINGAAGTIEEVK